MEYVPFWFFMTFIIGLIIAIVIEWLFPNMAKGAIIGLAAKAHKGEERKGGLVLAIYNFFPIFAIHEIFFLGRIATVVTIISLLLRNAGGMAPIAITMIVLFYIFSLILGFFCIFGEEAVVIRKLSIGKALKNSFKLVISYLGHVVFLLLLSFIIILRVFLTSSSALSSSSRSFSPLPLPGRSAVSSADSSFSLQVTSLRTSQSSNKPCGLSRTWSYANSRSWM